MSEPIFKITSYNPKTKRILRANLHESVREVLGPWRWPLQRFGSRNPFVRAEHVSRERRGVDLGYAVTSFDSELYVPVLAAQSGKISFAVDGEDADRAVRRECRVHPGATPRFRASTCRSS